MVTVPRPVTVAAGVLAPGHLGELTGYVPFELVDDVLEETLTVQRRTRLLPSRVGVYFVLAMAMFPRLGYLRVWDKLTAALDGLGLARPTEKALRDLRRRLGAAPLKLLFESLAGPAALPGTPGVRYRRWRTIAFDGCSSAKAPDRPRVCGWLGKIRHRYGEEGYPMLRIMALCETGSRALLGAVFGPVADCETSYAGQLLHLLDGTMLLLDDRGFDADDFLAKIAATGAQMLVRLNSRRAPARWAVLDDGSYLTRINGVRLRIIDAHVTVTASGGLELGGEYRLATTLLDPRRYPAAELVALYHERWEIELVFYSLRCTLQQGLVLRSQDPVGVQQEIWAQLAVYQALRRAMTDVVESVPGTDPDRAAFTVALETARDQLIAADGIVPVPGRHDCGRIGRAILENLLPPRRLRTAPRKIKCPISRYASPPDQLRMPATARITAVSVAICRVQAPDGRRDRTLQLMRTDPHRPWHAREIAAGLGLPHHRGLTGELSRWVKEGIICKAAPGTFTLHADWIGPDNPAGHGIFDTKTPALTPRPWGTSSVPPWPCILPGIRASKIPGAVHPPPRAVSAAATPGSRRHRTGRRHSRCWRSWRKPRCPRIRFRRCPERSR
jgi:Insertion element 4 transposase N-terminal/Transposase DDE domain